MKTMTTQCAMNKRLRPATLHDSEQIYKWRTSERIRHTAKNPSLFSYEDHSHWMKKILASSEEQLFVFEIDEVPIGVIHFFKIESKKQIAYWSIYVGDEKSAPGTGKMMAHLGFHQASELGLQRILAEIVDSNPVSAAFHKSLGFVEMGRKRGAVTHHEKKLDLLLMSKELNETENGSALSWLTSN